eukprot:TRINITY_DN25488_c0_g1_i2.p1 TRINITY_DN25488_c0_g1~~TRINITY_DN25488_c0_g1_i2.p1  ORF type:complete len:121 (+),score=13.73 TRINITY_DN25488_c0_g1_i2:82-444(+)
MLFFFFFQAEDGIRDAQESRGLGDVYKRQFSDISECIGTLYTVFRGSLSSRSLGTLYKHALSHPSRPILKYMASVGVIAVPNQKGQGTKADDTNESSTLSPSTKSAVSYTHLTLPTKRIV